jgi:hypothetical protein
MAAGGLDLYDELCSLLAALREAGVDYALCGALALAVHGVPRATQDIDLLIEPASLEPALAVARARGFVVEGDPLRFEDGTVLRRANKFEGADFLTLDLLLVGESLRPAWASRIEVGSERGPIRVVSREGLIRMKAAAGRPRDLADVVALRDLDR